MAGCEKYVWYNSGLTYILFCREHVDFAESTEEIAPLTEEEKKAKLEELRAKNAEKKAKQAILDKEEQRKNEACPFPLPKPNTSNTFSNRKFA
jgi:hypothetical protein